MSSYTAEEVAAKYEDEFGAEDGAVVHRLTESVSQLYHEWRLFLYFFGGPKERVDVLNAASGSTAKVLQNLLWDNAVLKIRALTDYEGTGSNRNMSLENLCRIAKRFDIEDLNGPFVEMRAKCTKSRKYADKYLAHRDFHHSVGRKSSTITRGETTASVKVIGDFVRLFHSQVRDTDYQLAPVMGAGNAEDFLAFLHLGALKQQEMRAEEMDDIKAGHYNTRAKYEWPEWVWAYELRGTPFSMH